MANIDEVFESAAAHLRSIYEKVSEDDLLYLYARYKQSTEGQCKAVKPLFWEFEKKKKWTSWKKLDSMEQLQAKQEYVEKISIIGPNFLEDSKKASTNIFSVKMSQPIHDVNDDEGENEFSQIFDYCKSGEIEKLKSEMHKVNLNKVMDLEGRNLLHWACDRGKYDVVKFLISECSFDVNEQDTDLLTPLHYAVQCEQETIIKLLLKHDANVNIPDSDGETPLNCAATSSRQIKVLFNILES